MYLMIISVSGTAFFTATVSDWIVLMIRFGVHPPIDQHDPTRDSCEIIV